ncbi:MAG: hypothetical protein ACSLFK_07610 [Gemmatimonadaceae bacterium]
MQQENACREPPPYYDTLDSTVHLIDREALPDPLPSNWRFWGSFDWGYSHWAVMGAWATDEDGVDYLLDSVWLRKLQDTELAREFTRELPAACLKQVYAGHDCWNRVMAYAASGESTADVFAKHGISLYKADIDLVNGGRAVNRQLKVHLDSRGNARAGVYIVRTSGNVRVFDQLGEIMPSDTDIRKPKKVDADVNDLKPKAGAGITSV